MTTIDPNMDIQEQAADALIAAISLAKAAGTGRQSLQDAVFTLWGMAEKAGLPTSTTGEDA